MQSHAKTNRYFNFIVKATWFFNIQGTGKSALSAACSAGNPMIVRRMLQKGANPNVPDKFLIVPLHYASHQGTLEIVKVSFINGLQFGFILD